MPPSRHSFEEVADRTTQAATIGTELAVLSSGWRFSNRTPAHAIGRPIGRALGKDDMGPMDDEVVGEDSLTATAEVLVEQSQAVAVR
jgi:hypothetical protein